MELLIALAIAAILLGVALPGYQHVVLKSSRAAARAALLELVARQEQYFVNHKRYARSLVELGLPGLYFIDGQGEPVSAGSAVYQIRLDLVDDAYRGGTALPRNRQLADTHCLAFSLSRLGVRSVTGVSSSRPDECW
jgi:type IV pilus assembly protein PilE